MLKTIHVPRHVHVFLLTVVVMSASTVHGQTTTFAYQGQLSDAGALANGSYDLRFALFDTAAGAAQIGANQSVPAVPVKDGVFTVQLDFGVSAFPGANRFLEIAVKPAGVGSYTTLAPRQQISSSPYAIRTLSAASADALSSACVGCVKDTQIQTVAGSKVSGAIPAASVPSGSGNYIQNTTAQQASSNFNIAGNGVVGGDLTVAGTLNANVSGNFIQNRTTPQAGANFNVGGNGTVGGVLSAGGVGVGTASPSVGVLLEVNGNTKLTPGGSGGFMQLGTPGGETGLSFGGATNRVDLRFDDSTLKLVAGPVGGPPASTSGVVINTSGNVGMGIANPTTGRLHVVGAAGPAIYGESSNRGVWGRSTGASRGVYGDSVSGEGVHGESTSGTGVAGVSHGPDSPAVGGSNDTGGTGVFGQSFGGFNTGFAMVADGHAKQTRDKGGWAKAMAFVGDDGSILQCYNSQTPVLHATGDCGISVTHGATGTYLVDFGFNVSDRFVSATAIETDILYHPSASLFRGAANSWGVQIRAYDFGAVDNRTESDFMIIVF
jgi:hypothetical protein